MTLKTVWEVAVLVDPQGAMYHLTDALTQDRQATLTALVTAYEGEIQKADKLVPFQALHQKDAFRKAISIVKQLLTPTI